MKAIIDEGPFISAQVVAKGLVDEVRFEDQMFGELKTLLNAGELKKVTSQNYMRALEGEGQAVEEPHRLPGGPGRHHARQSGRQRAFRRGHHLGRHSTSCCGRWATMRRSRA